MARVLIAGCGYVGAAAAARLVADGHEVWAMRRSSVEPPQGANALAADLNDPASLASLPEAVDVVLYTAAAEGRDDDAYRRAYVDGMRNLLGALEAGGHSPSRIFFTSSTGVYGHSHGEWVDEASRTEPTRFTGQRVLEGERLLLGGPFPATVVRLGGIYGPGRESMVERVRAGMATIDQPRRITNRIHRDDAAGILVHCMGLEAPADVYVGVDLEPSPMALVVRWLAREMGLPEPAVDPEAARGPDSNKRCSSHRLTTSGYRFAYPTFRSGYRALLAERKT